MAELIKHSCFSISGFTQVNSPRELDIVALSIFVYAANAKSIIGFTWYAVTEDLHRGGRVCGQALQPLL